MDIVHLLEEWGIEIGSSGLALFLQLVFQLFVIAVIAWIIYTIIRKFLSRIVRKIAGYTNTQWDDILFDQRFFNKLAYVIVPIAVDIAIAGIEWKYIGYIQRFVEIWIAIAFLLFFTNILDGINRVYQSYLISKQRPIQVFIQVIKIILYCITIIIVVSIMVGKSPENLLVGLSAFAAVLMLIFKDSILGFVAGIQLISNNMVRIGDWIVMPNSNADGEVLEINLITVKVQNWDKTISTIPTYKLVSESFTNWRGMQESEGRRIKRAVNIDINSIHYLSNEELEQLKQSSLLRDYINGKLDEIKRFNENREHLLDERRLTNIGTFREYMELWLNSNPDINLDMTHMVRQLQPGPAGVPIEIYCFSAKQKWIEYERVQADIFDHLFAVIPLFNLRIFQYSGNCLNE